MDVKEWENIKNIGTWWQKPKIHVVTVPGKGKRKKQGRNNKEII